MFRIAIILIFLTKSVYAQNASIVADTIIDLNHDENGFLINCKGSSKRHILKQFNVVANSTATYRIEIYEDSVSTLSIKRQERWEIIDTLSDFTSLERGDASSCEIMVPSARVTDFNRDGYADLEIWIGSNVNGNVWEKLFLFNPKTKQLHILKNEAEGDNIWDTPEFEAKDSSIHCKTLSGNWGIHFESTYKLKYFQAIPIDKKEYDNTRMDMSGRGAIYKHYVGHNRKWKLIKKITYRAH